jgi:hypothetical protein
MFPPARNATPTPRTNTTPPTGMVSVMGKLRTSQPEPKNFAGLLELMRKRFLVCQDASNQIRRDALEDRQFYRGDQWPPTVEADRTTQNRPCLTINRLPQFAKQVLNEQRASRPAIQVNPVGDGADVETAEIIQGIVRHIEVNSNADVAYDQAFQDAVISGFGYFRIGTAYAADDSFDQEITIERIEDPFTVYFDPTCREPDYSDAQYCFIAHDIPRELYEEMYPDSQVASLQDFRTIGDGVRTWFENGAVRVVEYFRVEYRKKTIVMLADGTVMDEDALMEHFAGDAAPLILKTKHGEPMIREVSVPIVKWSKCNAVEELDKAEWPGRWIPIIPVLGDEIIVDGKKYLYGIVRYAKDAQRQYNYMRTGVVEQIALSTKAPWLVEWSQIEGFEDWWRQANTRNFPFMPYRARAIGGQPVPPPIRNQYEPPIQAYVAALGQADMDLHSTTGIFDPYLGKEQADQSGKAIMALQRQGEQANSNLLDNLARAIRHAGRVILDLVPKIYDAPRVVRIVKPDMTHDMVPINGMQSPAPGQAPTMPQIQGGQPQVLPMPLIQQAVKKVYDVTVGRYDVTITMGKSFQSKRQEFVESVLSLVQAAPQTFQFVMDLLVRNMDWPGANEIADRLKMMLPPQLQAQTGDDGAEPLPPQAQAQIQSLLAEKAQLVAAVQAANNVIATKRLEMESKERIATLQARVDLIVAELNNKAAMGAQMAQLEYGAAGKQLEGWHETKKLDTQADLQQATQQHQVQMAQQAQGHEAAMAGADHAHELNLQRNAQDAAQQMAQQPQQPGGGA